MVVAKTGPVVQPATKPAAEPQPAVSQTGDQPVAIPVLAPSAATQPPKCDITACEAAYRSFTAEDCTYQPNNGPRRLCTKGTPPAAQIAPKSTPDAQAQATCNVAACTRAYISFTPADCTYQPIDGPRRLCTK